MPPKGYKVSEETKERISNALKGRPGHPQSTETRGKISKASTGRKWSLESRKKLSERLINGGALKGENHPGWKGGRKRHGAGYIQVKAHTHPRANTSGYVLEHILVWEQRTGKPVPREYSVHHLNGIKDDNRFENLAVMKKGEHIHRGKIYQERIRSLEKQLAECLQYRLQWPHVVVKDNLERLLKER